MLFVFPHTHHYCAVPIMRFYIILLLCLLLSACSKTPGHTDATSELPADTQAQANTIPIQSPPPGDPGPFIVQLQDKLPSRIFSVAANISHIAITYQTDVSDITQCLDTQINVCFKGFLTLATRQNPSQQKTIEIYESDTQSGAQILDLIPTQDGFALLYNNGRYVGDETQNRLLMLSNNGEPSLNVTLEEQSSKLVASLASLADDNILLCTAKNSATPPQINCQKLYPTGKMEPIAQLSSPTTIHHLTIAASKQKLLLAYTNASGLHAVFLDAPQQSIDFGPTTAQKPLIAQGHGAFLLMWQDDQAQLRASRIQDDAQHTTPITLAGLQYQLPQGLAAVPAGFLFAVNEGKMSNVALINPTADTWFLLDNSNVVRLIQGISALNIQNARLGKLVWQTAASLVAAR